MCPLLCLVVSFVKPLDPLAPLSRCSPRVAHSRQEHCESHMLRKRVKELEAECKDLQLECQVKEGRALELEGDLEVLPPLCPPCLGMSL